MPLCLVNGAFKPFKGPFHGKRLQGREGGSEETKADRWSEGSSGSIVQSPGRGTAGAAGVLTSRNDLRIRWGILLLLGEDPHVFPYLRQRLLPLCLPNPWNLPTSDHFPTVFTGATPAQINGENAHFSFQSVIITMGFKSCVSQI